MSLTPRFLLAAAIVALLGAASQWLGGGWLEYLWRFLLIGLAVATAYEYFLARQRKPEFALPADCRAYLGEHQLLPIMIRNPDSEALVVQMRFVDGPVIGLDDRLVRREVAANSSSQELLSFQPTKLGRCPLPDLLVAVRGCFGLGWWRRALPMGQHIFQVGPKGEFAAHARVRSRNRGIRASEKTGSGFEVSGLREYRAGDPYRAIDWKASSRVAKLITREHQDDQQLEIMIAVDVSAQSQVLIDGMSRASHYANLAARLTGTSIANEDRVGLMVYARDVLSVMPPGRGMQAAVAIQKMLASLEIQHTDPTPLQATLTLDSVLRHRALVVILASPSDRGSVRQMKQAVSILLPKHSVLVVDITDPLIYRYVSQQAHAEIDPYLNVAANEHIDGRETAKRALQRSGCHVVSTTPEFVDRQVVDTYRRLRQRRKV